MLDKGDIIVNVVDATNLERNLNLTLQLLERDVPVIVLLNMWDEARHKGIDIDKDKLEELLGVPVIPTVAVKGKGILDTINIITSYDFDNYKGIKKMSNEERWSYIGKIIAEVQKISDRKHTFSDVFDEITIRPLTGTLFAVFVLIFSFLLIRIIGEGLIAYVTEPFLIISIFLLLIT